MFRWFIVRDTYLEHGGCFVVPVLSAIAGLWRTTRHVKSAAFSRRRYLKTEHVETMAIFSLSVSRCPSLVSYACPRVRSVYVYLSLSLSLLSIEYREPPWIYVTQARARKARARISLYPLRLLRENERRKASDFIKSKSCLLFYERVLNVPFFFSLLFHSRSSDSVFFVSRFSVLLDSFYFFRPNSILTRYFFFVKRGIRE